MGVFMTNDNDLKKIKNALDSAPSELDISRWKSALKKKRTQSPVFKPWMQWTAAALLGFLLGAATFYNTHPDWMQNLAAVENVEDDATIEHIYVNSR
jgi:hypothetical protein